MNPDTTSDPEALLEHLCAFADKRRVARLHQFRDLCRQHYDRGSLDFRLVTIAALSLDAFDYTEASLRGGSGRVYRQYIGAFARSVGGFTKRPAPGTPGRRSVLSQPSASTPTVSVPDAVQGQSEFVPPASMTFLFGAVADSSPFGLSAPDVPRIAWERDQSVGSDSPPSLRGQLRDTYRHFTRELIFSSRLLPRDADLLCG